MRGAVIPRSLVMYAVRVAVRWQGSGGQCVDYCVTTFTASEFVECGRHGDALAGWQGACGPCPCHDRPCEPLDHHPSVRLPEMPPRVGVAVPALAAHVALGLPAEEVMVSVSGGGPTLSRQ